jgi:hypothetical protein
MSPPRRNAAQRSRDAPPASQAQDRTKVNAELAVGLTANLLGQQIL